MTDAAENSLPLVSVVIPTWGRSALVSRAVHSVLAQTLHAIEVLVVIDGPDPSTRAVLAEIRDPRLRVVELPEKQGGSGARNAGVLQARSSWVAFLDDDDEWLPHKLERQWAIAETTLPSTVVACYMRVQTPRSQFVVPRRVPSANEPISNYLFMRRGLFHGDGFFITSMLFTSKELLLAVPFQDHLTTQQDVDWLLRACSQKSVFLIYVQEALGVWYVDENRQRVSTRKNWQQALDWIQRCRQQNLVTPEAYAAFILTQINAQVAHEGDRKNAWLLLKLAIQHGKPNLNSYVLFLTMWLIPQAPRRIVRDFILSRLRSISH